MSGVGEPELLETLLGISWAGEFTKETRTYISPADGYGSIFGEFNSDFPMPFECRLPYVRYDSSRARCAAAITLPYTVRGDGRFASIHSDPPGLPTDSPALLIGKYGKGNVIWSAAPIELDERLHYRELLMNLMGLFFDKRRCSVTAATTKNVEIVAFETGNSMLISAVDLKCTEELIPVRAFPVAVRTGRPVESVRLLPGGEPVVFTQEGGEVRFTARELVMFDMYEIVFN